MADSLITNLTLRSTLTGTEEMPLNVPGTPALDRKTTLAILKAFIKEAVVETVPAVAQVTDVDFGGAVPSNLFSNYIDIPFDTDDHLLRVWFDDDTAPGTPPATPTGGRITRIGLTGTETEGDMATAFAAAVNADVDLTASASGTVATVTQPAGGMSTFVNTTSLALTVVTTGADARDRLLAVSGELVTLLSALAVQFTASSKILARITNGAGAAEEATIGQVLDFLSSTTGAVPYRSAIDWQVLTGDGAIKLRTNDSPVLQWSDSKGLTLGVTSSSTNMANVTGMTITLPGAGTYAIEISGSFIANVTTEGIGFAMNGPTATLVALCFAYGVTTTYASGFARYTSWDSGPLVTASGGATSREFRVSGVVSVSEGGTLALRFRAETGGANSVTVEPGTNMHVNKL